MFRGGIGPPEIILILLVVVLLFGAKKLPETARGLGRSLRIFKAETKSMKDDDAVDVADVREQPSPAPREVEARRDETVAPPVSTPVSNPARERATDPSDRDA
ncbi:MAG TPA: Sec-independent protein translocase subunit TatA [Jiangellaceae bacterium]|nr:Sec-independent protein translocase subunit TatA [Jiangellaceae bacterium]